MADNISKVPPHSVDAERSTLGSLIIDKEAIIKVADMLKPEDFYHDVHGIIFQTVIDLFDKRQPIDLLTITTLLNDRGQLQTVGGASYVTELADSVPTASHIFQYASIVKQKAIHRRLINAGDKIVGFGYDESSEIEELLEKSEQTLFNVSQTFVKDRFVHVKEVLSKTYEKISDLHDPEKSENYRGIATGFPSLDNILSGFQPSDLVILAARPAMGKTSFALNMAQNIAKQGNSVAIISLEMSKEQLVERMFCALLQVDSWKMRTGQLTEDDFARIGHVMDDLNSMNIFIDDSVGNSIVELKAKARRLKMESGLDFIIIDYLQLMTTGTHSGGNRVQEISEISRSLKALARELHVPILSLSQLSRAVEMRIDKAPQLSDLRESGAIEQDADVVMMLYRDEYYNPDDTERPGITDLYIRKHRNGPIGKVELAFKKEQMKFLEIERNHDFSTA